MSASQALLDDSEKLQHFFISKSEDKITVLYCQEELDRQANQIVIDSTA
ncbi:MAG: hypothetical protein RL368_2197 [Pseudomonadota bacterium]|jgi:hypothetical protein